MSEISYSTNSWWQEEQDPPLPSIWHNPEQGLACLKMVSDAACIENQHARNVALTLAARLCESAVYGRQDNGVDMPGLSTRRIIDALCRMGDGELDDLRGQLERQLAQTAMSNVA